MTEKEICAQRGHVAWEPEPMQNHSDIKNCRYCGTYFKEAMVCKQIEI